MKLLNAVVGCFLASSCFAKIHEYPEYDAIVKKSHSKLTGNYKAYRLENGLDVVIYRHNNSTSPMEVSLTVGVGSANVGKKNPVGLKPIEGIAHLVEHSIFYANQRFPTPYEIDKFVASVKGYQNAFTIREQTTYEMNIKDKFQDGLTRFAHMFVSPIFTTELLKSESEIIHNEWLTNEHMIVWNSGRYPQLLMTKGQPSELFATGNRDTLGVSDLLDQVKLFWKTHYTADNMKLAISIHKDVKDIETAIFEHFSLIPTSPKDAPVVVPTSVPFWSADSSDKYLQAYPKTARRSKIHFYWHIHCDEGAMCLDSIQMMKKVINFALKPLYSTRNLTIRERTSSYNEFILEVSFELRTVELTKVPVLKDEAINAIKAALKGKVPKFSQSAAEFATPSEMSNKISTAMMFAPITEAPLRAHVSFVVSDASLKLMEKNFNVILEQSPRILVSYKSSLLKDLNKTSFKYDPFYGIYYQYAPFAEKDNKQGLTPKPLPTNLSSITITIKHDYLLYTHRFLKQVFIEMLVISLKDKRVKCEHKLENELITLKIFLEEAKNWEKTMQTVMESFHSLSLSSKETFKKAKERSALEMKNFISSAKKSGDVAKDYAVILTSLLDYDEKSLLVSDPNPEGASFKDVAAVGLILRQIGSFKVDSDIRGTDAWYLNSDLVKKRVDEMWNSSVKTQYSASYVQPAAGQTFIYAPSPIATSDSATMILFPILTAPEFTASLFSTILYPFFYSRLRTDMQLTYTPVVNTTYTKHFYITAQSFSTPEIMQEIITNIIKEIPSYITKMDSQEWTDLVGTVGLKESELTSLLNGDDTRGKTAVIELVRKYLLGPTNRRLVIQLWTQNQYLMRAKYLANLERSAPPTTKVIYSISDYPRSAQRPEELQYDSSLLKDFEVVEREITPSKSTFSTLKGLAGGLWSRMWRTSAPAPVPASAVAA